MDIYICFALNVMAPFGKCFLKARLKNRSNHRDGPGEKEVQVQVCEEEKVVCGITWHTTCADVVQALLEDHNCIPESRRVLLGQAKDYCLQERWKGCERVLPPLTRILQLWEAWGEQQPYVQFVLVSSSEFALQAGRQVAGPRGPSSRSRQQCPGLPRYIHSLPAERRKRVVRKAFQKLERMKRQGRPPGAGRINTMVQLVIAQDHTIHEQVNRMRELDWEMERIEKQLHWDHQWKDAGSICFVDGSDDPPHNCLVDEYLSATEGLDQLDSHLKKQWHLIEKLMYDIDAEIRESCRTGSCDALEASPSTSFDLQDIHEVTELEQVRGELESCMWRGVLLHMQVRELEGELKCSEDMLLSRCENCMHLEAQLKALNVVEWEEPE